MLPTIPNKTLVPVVSSINDEQFSQIAKGGKFLPRVQLFSSSSAVVKQKKFESGHYGLVTAKDTQIDMGESFDCLILGCRAKAMRLDGPDGKPISIFNKDSDEFAKIVEKADSGPNTKCMYGPEFLLWLPEMGRFATMFFSNATMRREAPEMYKLRGNVATCNVVFIESKQYGGWHGPEVVPCSKTYDLPDATIMKTEQDNFIAQQEETDEVVEAVDEPATTRER